MKKKKLLSLFLVISLMVIGIISCAKKHSGGEIVSAGSGIPAAEEKTISIIYPINAEGMRQLSEDQIKGKYQTAVDKLLPQNRGIDVRSMSMQDFKTYVYQKIDSDVEVQNIITELKNNGVYFAVGNTNKTVEITRYPGTGHELFTKNGTFTLIKKILIETGNCSSNDCNELLTKLITTPGDIETEFSKNVVAEDSNDLVFNLGNFSINANLKIKDPLGIFTLDTITINEVLAVDDAKTIAHFWDPDRGWNAGNTNIWPYIRKLVAEMLTSKGQGALNVNEELINLILRIINPEYAVAMVQNPPSAYYKALCYWYGWKKITGGNNYSIQEENNPGIITLVKSNPTQAAIYLAHIVHLLQDMTVPAHVHNSPHGDVRMGGEDAWENNILKGMDFIGNVIAKDSYQFNISSNNQVEGFKRYSSRNVDLNGDYQNNGIFYKNAYLFYQKMNGFQGLWPFFFNAAQATQFFPAIKGKAIAVAGNNTIQNGSFFLSGEIEAFSGQAYNDSSKIDPNFDPTQESYKIISSEKPYSKNGTYYLVYIGSGPIPDEAAIQSFISIDEAGNKVSVTSSDFQILYLSYPFDKMADTLLPLSSAITAKLIRNYFWFY